MFIYVLVESMLPTKQTTEMYRQINSKEMGGGVGRGMGFLTLLLWLDYTVEHFVTTINYLN